MTIEEIEKQIAELQKEVDKLKTQQEDIFLLSAEEYQHYQNEIPTLHVWWWLRSPGAYAQSVEGVTEKGDVDITGPILQPIKRFAPH